MPSSGKYDFKGIKRLGAAGLRLAVASSPYTAWILKGGSLTNLLFEFLSNWLANKGLVILNAGADFVGGHWNQAMFDEAMDEAIKEITEKGGREKLTESEKRAIDNEVIKAARRFVVITKP